MMSKNIKKIPERVKERHLQMLKQVGEDGLYKEAIAACLFNIDKRKHPEIDALDLSEAFLSLYRRTGDSEYLVIHRVLRKAAHKVYWELSKQSDFKRYYSERFITLV